MRGKKVAIIIHPLDRWGGAEQELRAIADVYPDATIFTAWYLPELVAERFSDMKIQASFMQRLPQKKNLQEEYVPLLPFAYKSLKLNGFDKILIVSDGFEKNITKPAGAKIILNILTPPRFLWLDTRSTLKKNKLTIRIYRKFFEKPLHKKWKEMDKVAVSKADLLLSISEDVQSRVAKVYGVHSEVLYPPVNTDHMKFNPNLGSREDWYLYFGRVESYKGVELAIRTCAVNGWKLKVAGTGSDMQRLKGLVRELNVGSQIDFTGYVSEEEKKKMFFKCKALLYSVRDEDFGIVPLEASAAGCPVVAFNGGGVKETVIDNVSGTLFNDFTIVSFTEAINRLDQTGISPEECQKQASLFKKEAFESKLLTFMNSI